MPTSGQRVRRSQKFSDEPRIQGPKPRRILRAKHTDAPTPGDWYLVMKHIERDGVAYLPLNHHLVETNAVPERVPSNGAKGNQVGQNTVPVNASGMINTEGWKASDVWSLYRAGAIRPIDPRKSHQRLMEGQRMSKTLVPKMIPSIKRVTNLAQQYQQATTVPLTVEGMQNLATAQQRMPSPFDGR